jgi:glycine cleavage system H protein
MEFPDNLKYSKEHEWVRVEDDGSVVIGITEYAQDQLGDIVFIELPEVSEKIIAKDDPFAVVESVKAVSDVYAPVSGKVVEVNDELPKTPEIVNQDCYGDGWMVRMELEHGTELEDMLSAADYQQHVDDIS